MTQEQIKVSVEYYENKIKELQESIKYLQNVCEHTNTRTEYKAATDPIEDFDSYTNICTDCGRMEFYQKRPY